MKNITFIIKGLTCQTCVATIEKEMKKVKGIESIVVNLTTEKATVQYDSSVIKVSEIFDNVRKIGYEVMKISEETLDEREKEKSKELKKQFNEFIIAIIFGSIILYMTMGNMLGAYLPKIIHYDTNPKIYATIQLIFSIPVIYVGRKLYVNGIKRLIMRAPSMDSLIFLGTGAAFLYSFYGTVKVYEGNINYVHNLYYEAGSVIIALVLLGGYLENISKGKTSESIKKLMQLQTKQASLIRDDKVILVDIDEVDIGDILLIKPGESIPTDGVVIEGTSSVDESMLTGESVPVKKIVDSKIFGATINGTGSLKIKVTEVGEGTILSKIIKLVENAQNSKAPIARMADTISGHFVAVTMGIAFFSSITWYILGTLEVIELNRTPSIFAITILISVLIIACPCALGLATPTSIIVGTGKGAELGILIKSGEALEKASKIDTVVFDKTGTITVGKPSITDILILENMEEDKFLKLVGSLESKSEHPLASAIVNEISARGIKLINVKEFNSITGEGVIGVVETDDMSSQDILIGNIKLMNNFSIKTDAVVEKKDIFSNQGKTVIYVATKEKLIGIIAVADKVRQNSIEVVKKLQKIGLEVIMLTGDNEKTAKAIAKEVGITRVIAEVSPEDKYSEVKKLQSQGNKVVMVGDGINDTPALTQADVGIAVGGGADIALESADIVLMSKDIKDVPKAIELSRATVRNIKQNLFWAFVYNGIGIPIAAGVLYPITGQLLNPIIAGAAMAISSFSVISNALRLKTFK